MRVFLMIILVIVFSSCVRNKNGQVLQETAPVSEKVFEVTEVIQTNRYTYLKVKENLSEKWVAVAKQEVNAGEVYYYDEALQMNNFPSKDLNRTFDVIYFVNQISKTPLNQNITGNMPAHSGKVESVASMIEMEKGSGELTVAQVFKNRDVYADKEFEIRGIVVKVNEEVMGKNWIHIQDGTKSNDNFDLTITTKDLAEVGDLVTFKGKLTLDKNFGSGYYYDVIMEDAVLLNKQLVSKQQ